MSDRLWTRQSWGTPDKKYLHTPHLKLPAHPVWHGTCHTTVTLRCVGSGSGHMLRSQSKCTQNVIGGYIGRKMIQSPQFTQDVPTGFQVTLPPVYIVCGHIMHRWTSFLNFIPTTEREGSCCPFDQLLAERLVFHGHLKSLLPTALIWFGPASSMWPSWDHV